MIIRSDVSAATLWCLTDYHCDNISWEGAGGGLDYWNGDYWTLYYRQVQWSQLDRNRHKTIQSSCEQVLKSAKFKSRINQSFSEVEYFVERSVQHVHYKLYLDISDEEWTLPYPNSMGPNRRYMKLIDVDILVFALLFRSIVPKMQRFVHAYILVGILNAHAQILLFFFVFFWGGGGGGGGQCTCVSCMCFFFVVVVVFWKMGVVCCKVGISWSALFVFFFQLKMFGPSFWCP